MELEEARQIRIDALRCKKTDDPSGESAGAVQLVCLRSGSCLIEAGGISEALDPAAVAIIPPNALFRLTTGDETADGIRIELPPELGALFQKRGFVSGMQFLRASDRFVCLRADEGSCRRLARLLTLLAGYAGGGRGAVYGRLAVIELLILELQQAIGEAQGEPAYGGGSEAGQSQLIKGVIGYINESYMEDIHLDNIAKRFWVSPSYLSRQFKEKLGFNITHFIMERRVYAAQRLLLTTDLRIAEISKRIGYKDAAYFNTVFNRITGVSPGKYRNQKKM